MCKYGIGNLTVTRSGQSYLGNPCVKDNVSLYNHKQKLSDKMTAQPKVNLTRYFQKTCCLEIDTLKIMFHNNENH